jgi:hypothetical protein
MSCKGSVNPIINPNPFYNHSITWQYEVPHYVALSRLLFFQFLGVGWDWVHLLRRPLFGLLYQPRMIDDECGAVGGMRIGNRNRSTRRKSTPVLLCLQQIPHNLTWDRTLSAAVGSRRLTTEVVARPQTPINSSLFSQTPLLCVLPLISEREFHTPKV